MRYSHRRSTNIIAYIYQLTDNIVNTYWGLVVMGKPIYKKWWAWVIAFFAVLIVYGAITGVNQAKEQIEEEKNNPVEEKEETKTEPDEEKDEKEQSEDDKEVDTDDIKSSELFEGELTLTYEPGTLWSENSFFRVVHSSFKDVEQAFDDKEVDSVVVMIYALMTDEKGNEESKPVITYRYTRDDFNELNYDKFIDMSVGEEWRILNEAEAYFINPGIRKT